MAIAPEAMVDRAGFERAVERAKARARRDYGITRERAAAYAEGDGVVRFAAS